jgi:hypothetical protein
MKAAFAAVPSPKATNKDAPSFDMVFCFIVFNLFGLGVLSGGALHLWAGTPALPGIPMQSVCQK